MHIAASGELAMKRGAVEQVGKLKILAVDSGV
jgi:hypothetical protein